MNVLSNERGSALILAMLVIVLLTVIGIFGAQTSSVETRIAANDRQQKVAFHQAEAGAQVGRELIEQNIENRNWTSGSNVRNVAIVNGGFLANTSLGNTDYATDANKDAYFPANSAPGTPITSQPHTNLRFGSNTRLSTGSAIQMVAGYEGRGKSAAQSGAWVVYDIRSQRLDTDKSMSRVWARWVHVM